MRLLDLFFPKLADNLSFDEVLLNEAESGRGGETLRFWESPETFVVLGVGQAVAEEVHTEACNEDSVPILRRCSAGGCVLQGPGCLSFTLILSLDDRPAIRTIGGSYREILGRISETFEKQGVPIAPAGISDLALEGHKVAGNAQRRRKHYILHHGVFLHRANLALMERYLKEPARRPEYRGQRQHRQFVRNLPLPSQQIKNLIRQSFEVEGPCSEAQAHELRETRKLTDTKYENPEWIHRR